MSNDFVLRVALPLPVPRLFDYAAPLETPQTSAADIGRRMRVPFGPRELIGVVAAIGAADRTASELRHAHAYLDDAPMFHGELLESLHWLARYTHAPLGEVLTTALPALLRRGEAIPDTRAWAWQRTALQRPALRGKPAIFSTLLDSGLLDEATLNETLEGWRSAARALQKRGLIERIAIPASRIAPKPQPGSTPNDQQQGAIDAIGASVGYAAYLLNGVTGSGKTEVYLHAIARCIAQGKQALVLVPEIGLTPQILSRFRARLGMPIHALHSGLNDRERARTWAAAWRGEARVIVGTRSSVFTPLPNAGLIVIDEEHDGSYKQQDGIRYHARDFALVRGKALDVPVLLGSATPSLESLYNAQQGRYRHLHLHRRAGNAQPPRVRVLDVRKRPLDAGLSTELLTAIAQALAAGGQVMVFKNRRGYAPVLLCHDCGWSAQCARCSTATSPRSMTVHANGKRLQCHHCGARRSAPLACPDCASLALQPQGAGTERIEDALRDKFPDVPIIRIDRDSTRRKDALEGFFNAFGSRPGILVGTQMLAKGHDLPQLTLVAVVGIDEGLYSSDFRAAEKTSQLLIQVAGRAGRADRPGEVWLQTHHPDHPLLGLLLGGGYGAFAEAELNQREAAGFPPFAYLALLRAEAKQSAASMAFLHAAQSILRAALSSSSESKRVDVIGPLVAPVPKHAGLHRAQLLLSSNRRRGLHALLDAALPAIYALPEARKTRWSLDVDPLDLA